MIGRTISHYRILEKLGEGGMGVVYKAEDTTLGRAVALKFLPPEMTRDPEATARLLQEARAAAALAHPNICTVHEIGEAGGQTFIVMGLIEGESLGDKIARGPLRLREAVDIAVQVAEGLDAAHRKGIVHRDMKPGNVMVTTEGRAKVMDFGLAVSPGQTRLTRTGTTTGTVAYMSPEQSRAGDVDHRTDIWSFGVMLYEMVSGRRPFGGNYEQAVVHAILNDQPEPLTALRTGVPMELERIAGKAMAKRPNERYQTVSDMLVDLRAIARNLEAETITRTAGRPQPSAAVPGRRRWRRGLAVGAVVAAAVLVGLIWVNSRPPGRDVAPAGRRTGMREGVPSIAVLPFLDMSPERDQEYFCEGMAEELINALTQLGGIKVSARTSSFQYAGPGHDVRDIGNDLGVETVLEGSVRKAGSRLRITAQLINVADGYHLWSESFDRDMEDVFAIQDEISLAIVEELKPELLGDEEARVAGRATANPEAYNLYLRGRWYWNKRTPPDLMRGIDYFERAIDIAPDYALAYAGMADCYTALAEYSASPPEGTAAAARGAALRALELDDTLPEAHAALGYIKLVYDWDWRGAETDLKRAIELDPNYAPAHHRYAVVLSIMGRYDEGLQEVRRAKELEPHCVSISTVVGLLLCNVGELDSAIEELERALEMDPGFANVYFTLGAAYLYSAKYDEALATFEESNRILGGRNPGAAAMIGITHAFSGDVDEAERALADLTALAEHGPVSSSLIAVLCFSLGRRDEGFEWLERAYEERELLLRVLLPVFRRPDVAYGDPRFQDLLGRMGLET
jgi:serine/threonine-protein kinase